MSFFEEADQELAVGNAWRAKEILHRSIKYSGYDVQLFEKLGIVLLQMNDLAEAGKYLFCRVCEKRSIKKLSASFCRNIKISRKIFFIRSRKWQSCRESPSIRLPLQKSCADLATKKNLNKTRFKRDNSEAIITRFMLSCFCLLFLQFQF